MFFGKLEPMNERLVFSDIVGGGKVDLQCVFELVAFRRSEDNAGSQAGAHLGAVKMHPPMGGVGRWWQILGLGPVDEEIGQCLRLDGGAGLVVDGVGSQLYGPFGHTA